MSTERKGGTTFKGNPLTLIGNEVKVGQKVDAGGVLCRLYYTNEENVEEAAQVVEDSFRISNSAPEERALILEVVG